MLHSGKEYISAPELLLSVNASAHNCSSGSEDFPPFLPFVLCFIAFFVHFLVRDIFDCQVNDLQICPMYE